MKGRPYVLTIAGFDPSGGAGLLADVKTLEQLKCQGLAIGTVNTIQNDTTLKKCYWTPIHQIKEQIELLFERFEIHVVKIGVVEHWNVLREIVAQLKSKNSEIQIILDPVLRSSSAFTFHQPDVEQLHAVLSEISLITPNYEEMQLLYPDMKMEEAAQKMSAFSNVLLKGGHAEEVLGRDILYTVKEKVFHLNAKKGDFFEKHGSGCVLSSAIAGYLALGFPLLKACYRAKRYTEKVLRSNKSLLGYHA